MRRADALRTIVPLKYDYFLAAGFFVVVLFFFAGVAAFLSLSRPPIRLIASAALKGNCRTEVAVWPAELSVISTRRLLAILMVTILDRARLRSSVVSSAFC